MATAVKPGFPRKFLPARDSSRRIGSIFTSSRPGKRRTGTRSSASLRVRLQAIDASELHSATFLPASQHGLLVASTFRGAV
jgi:hypothetical protein